MAFTPGLHQQITIDQVPYQFTEHPNARGQTYCQIGRRASVYQVASPGGQMHALKVFKPAFRTPTMVDLSARLRQFAQLPGLAVCERKVVTPNQHGALLKQYPDLEYSAIMPWMTGESWYDIILPTEENDRRAMTPAQSKQYASSFAATVATLEQHGIAHCDLSGPNVVVVPQTGSTLLVDVEDLYAPGLPQPAKPPGGSPGYAHRTAPIGLWSAESDRFAAAILIVEMLTWCDERIRSIADKENYWNPAEMQQKGMRYQVMTEVLRERWGGDAVRVFGAAWASNTLADCPPLATWASLLGAQVDPAARAQTISTPIAPPLPPLPASQAQPQFSQPIAPPLPPSQPRAQSQPIAPPLPPAQPWADSQPRARSQPVAPPLPRSQPQPPARARQTHARAPRLWAFARHT